MKGQVAGGAASLLVALQVRSVSAQDPMPECIGEDAVPDACYADVLCPEFEPYWDLRRSVVHISGPDIGGTGVLLNNGGCSNPDVDDADCGRPYLLTALHVGSGAMWEDLEPGEVKAIENETNFTFGFEALGCGSSQIVAQVAVAGSSIIARSVGKDLMLLYLDTWLPPELGGYFAGWGNMDFNPAVCISHPCGGPKKISLAEADALEYQKAVQREVIIVEAWDVGAVASTSSGAPLLTPDDGNLLGLFTDSLGPGHAACYDPALEPYERFTAIASIMDFLPHSMTQAKAYLASYDADSYAGIVDVETNGQYYGDGEYVQITARHEVVLVPVFHADKGSHIIIEVRP